MAEIAVDVAVVLVATALAFFAGDDFDWTVLKYDQVSPKMIVNCYHFLGFFNFIFGTFTTGLCLGSSVPSVDFSTFDAVEVAALFRSKSGADWATAAMSTSVSIENKLGAVKKCLNSGFSFN